MEHCFPHRMAGSWLELDPTESSKIEESDTKLRESESVNGSAVERSGTTAQIAAIGQQDTDAAHNADPGLHPGVEKPFSRTQEFTGISDRSGIKKRTQLNEEKRTVVNGLIPFGAEEQIPSPQWRTAFAAIESDRVTAKPKIVVAFHTQLKELVERDIAQRVAASQPGEKFVIVAARFRQPTRFQLAFKRGESAKTGTVASAGADF